AGVAKGIAHPAMASRHADARAAHRPAQRRLLFRLELPRRPHRHDQIELFQLRFIVKRIERIRHLDREPFFLQHALEEPRHFSGLMPIPSAPDDQGFLLLSHVVTSEKDPPKISSGECESMRHLADVGATPASPSAAWAWASQGGAGVAPTKHCTVGGTW